MFSLVSISYRFPVVAELFEVHIQLDLDFIKTNKSYTACRILLRLGEVSYRNTDRVHSGCLRRLECM